MEPLNVNILDLSKSIFKLTMKSQAPKTMVKPPYTNPMTKLWMTMINNGLLIQRLSEYMKLVEINIVSCLGFMEDEYTFSTFAFMKDKSHNLLG
jgi:hypothetical protein